MSSFPGIGKKTTWSNWNAYPEVTGAFEQLAIMTEGISEMSMDIIERFVVLMYCRKAN